MQQNKDYAHDWLKRRGINAEVLNRFNITWHNHPSIGGCIRIPIDERFSKYRRDPKDDRKPKYLYDKGGSIQLYGLDKLTGDEKEIVVTEGELDTLVLWSMNIPAVSSTGGAMTFKEEWRDQLPNAQFYICYDNDDAGADGAVKTQKILGPDSKIILIPETVGVKDISDFVGRGGDFRGLMRNARSYPDVATVEADKEDRASQWLSTRFHEAYLTDARRSYQRASRPRTDQTDDVLKAKEYPLTELIEFRGDKALCPFHNERTPSLQYYRETNSAYCFGCGKLVDSIEAYRNQNPKLSFKQAVDALNRL